MLQHPDCRRPTVGPHSNPEKSVCSGEAAHIVAASTEGPRSIPISTPEIRKSVKNGIWLCAACHELIDKDPEKYTIQLLENWKGTAEKRATDRQVKEGLYEKQPEEELAGIMQLDTEDELHGIRDHLDALMIHDMRKWARPNDFSKLLSRLQTLSSELEVRQYGVAVGREILEFLSEAAERTRVDLTEEDGTKVKTILATVLYLYAHEYTEDSLITVVETGFSLAYDGIKYRNANTTFLCQGCAILCLLPTIAGKEGG